VTNIKRFYFTRRKRSVCNKVSNLSRWNGTSPSLRQRNKDGFLKKASLSYTNRYICVILFIISSGSFCVIGLYKSFHTPVRTFSFRYLISGLFFGLSRYKIIKVHHSGFECQSAVDALLRLPLVVVVSHRSTLSPGQDKRTPQCAGRT